MCVCVCVCVYIYAYFLELFYNSDEVKRNPDDKISKLKILRKLIIGKKSIKKKD